jgi:hypothetical protein
MLPGFFVGRLFIGATRDPLIMHVIRLRRPWEKCVGDAAESIRIDVPETAATETLAAAAYFRYRRGFNLPTGLHPASRVYLRIDGWEGRLESVIINGKAIEVTERTISADITDLLETHNQIGVCLAGDVGMTVRLSGEVTLAISEDQP